MTDKLYAQMGIRIKAIRNEKGLTREQLAEKADISTQFLADIEAGNKGMSAATLYKLSKALCISGDYLLFGNENNECDIEDIIKAIPDSQKENAKKLLAVFAEALGNS
ncbi:MAG: helix-turn-helix transcriptional regulator [Clostridiales bacterium]|nr:helix-turn-helix transcriptional regulator [Clostridiales bacterium]